MLEHSICMAAQTCLGCPLAVQPPETIHSIACCPAGAHHPACQRLDVLLEGPNTDGRHHSPRLQCTTPLGDSMAEGSPAGDSPTCHACSIVSCCQAACGHVSCQLQCLRHPLSTCSRLKAILVQIWKQAEVMSCDEPHCTVDSVADALDQSCPHFKAWLQV